MCGIVGIMGNHDVAQDIYDSLTVLQHRGQDSAGIMTYKSRFHLKKGNGLVRDIFHTKNMKRLVGNMGIGHVRYPTAGGYESSEAQPFFVNSPYGIALIHNGNLTNYDELKDEVTKKNIRYLNTSSDSEVLLNVLANELLDLHVTTLTPELIFKAIEGVYRRIKGGYAVIAMIAGYGLVAFRDPNGIRPLSIGKKDSGTFLPEYMLASESVALDIQGFDFLADVQPGEAYFIDMNRDVHKKQIVEKKWAPCIFEYVYLARPDSIIDDVSVYKTRLRMGNYLGEKIKKANLDIDVVIPVPDSARSAALAVAQTLGIKYREGLVKNRYIGRTFIMPEQKTRKKSISYKLNPIILELRNRNVLLVDDSIVRGNTSKKIVDMVRRAGAKKVYFASASPALINPCMYGVDMASRKDFIAHNLSVDEIAKVIGVDKLIYQDIDDLVESAKAGNPDIPDFCKACMDGKYPTSDIDEEKLMAIESDRNVGKNGLVDEVNSDQMSFA